MKTLALPAVLYCVACAGPREQFDVKYASDFKPVPTSASIFGVLHDGLMREDGAAVLGARIFRAFRRDACEIAYDVTLSRSNPEMFAFLDRQARDNGISDDLLQNVAAHAKGEVIVAFQMFGRPPRRSEETGAAKPVLLAHGGDMGGPSPYPRSTHKEPDTFELSAAFFSVRLHHTVAVIRMEYSGSSVDDAMTKLSDKLVLTFPEVTCVGWSLPSGVPRNEESEVLLKSAASRARL